MNLLKNAATDGRRPQAKWFGWLALLAVGTAQASDFSKLAEPTFARSMLISFERRTEMACVGVARANVALGRGWTAVEARDFARPILDRLSIETGEPNEQVSGRADSDNVAIDMDYLTPEEKKTKFAELELLKERCKPYFDAFRTGGVAALTAKLQPSRGLIPLLSLPYCLAVIRQPTGQPYGTMFEKDEVADVDKMVRSTMDKAARAALDKSVADQLATFKASPLDGRTVEAHQVACLATIAQTVPNR